jgi:hypothetical protein
MWDLPLLSISLRSFVINSNCMQGPDAANKLPGVTPHTKCRLRLLKQERIKDYLLMEEEFIRNQERLKPQEEKNEEERTKVCQKFSQI